MTDLLRRLVREPLLHFLVLGGVLFALLGRGDPAVEGSDIVVSKDDIARIAAGFASTWRRPPSADELNAVVADDIREQVLYRAGLALGLDKEDTIVRRRIRQKMEFFLEGTVEAPKENDLETFLAANPDKFRTEPQVAFRQVFVSAKREGAQAEAEALLPQLVSAGSGPSSFGDATLLPAAVDLAPLSAIAAQFGVGFAKDMTNLSPAPGPGQSLRPTATTSFSLPVPNPLAFRRSARCVPLSSGNGSRSAAKRSSPRGMASSRPATPSASRAGCLRNDQGLQIPLPGGFRGWSDHVRFGLGA
jgi:hypothetical protein